MRNFVLFALLATSSFCTAQSPSVNQVPVQLDGSWWMSNDAAEQYGLLHGLGDCLVWEAHNLDYNSTPEQVQDKITKFYETHPKSRKLSLLEVWQRVLPRARSVKPSPGGETWGEPHWYLNADWWRGSNEDIQLGFVKGYLWCMRTQVEGPHPSYSRSPVYYRGKISGYVAKHESRNDAVATTLARYQDPKKAE